MRLAAALTMRVRVSSLRSAWVRRRAVSTERRAELGLAEILFARADISDLYADLFIDHLDRIGFKRNFAGHPGRLARGNVERPEMKCALHDLADQNPFLRERHLAMGAFIGRHIDRLTHAIQRDMRTIGKRGLPDLAFDDLVDPA